MSLMAAASRAAYLDPPHAVAVVLDILQVILIKRPVKRWPACAGVEFVTRAEQRQTAQTARVGPVLLIIEECSAESGLRTVVEQYAVFLFI